MTSAHCAVVNCSNGGYRLFWWKEEKCEIHGVLHRECTCNPPFRLFSIPTRQSKPAERDIWINLINRLDGKKKGKLLSPSKDQKVCSIHFKDGAPTKENPYPTLQLGYPDYESKVKRVLSREVKVLSQSTRQGGRKTRQELPQVQAVTNPDFQQGLNDEGLLNQLSEPADEDLGTASHSLDVNELLIVIFTMLAVVVLLTRLLKTLGQQIIDMTGQISKVKEENKKLNKLLLEMKEKLESNVKVDKPRNFICLKRKSPPDLFKNFITDKNINYYTGIGSKTIFKRLHDYANEFVRRRFQGKAGSCKTIRNFTKVPKKFGPKQFLQSQDEMLLTLMRLRLGLDNKDLADRFHISVALTSKIFTSWIKALAAILFHMIYVPDLETVIATKPARFRGSNLTNLMAIIDCTEFFIETPQDLTLQSLTWSEYKHHNTLKILVAVCPNSMISFVSSAYHGRISDTELTKDCGFLELLPPCSSVMADKGFNLGDECARLLISAEVPPGRRGMSQMTSAAVRKTKKIANLRILVEQVIRRLKSFKILKDELTLSSSVNIDEMVTVCAALSNLKGPIYTT